MGFVNKLDLRVYDVGEWVVLNDLVYQPRNGLAITVGRGFVTDLASIPGLLRGILNVNGRSRMPAVLHDALYCLQPYPRERADALFYEALVSVGVHPVIARIYWLGVRIGGWIYFNHRAPSSNTQDFVPDTYWSTE